MSRGPGSPKTEGRKQTPRGTNERLLESDCWRANAGERLLESNEREQLLESLPNQGPLLLQSVPTK
eukprot:1560121-Rhodomonas_salina.2